VNPTLSINIHSYLPLNLSCRSQWSNGLRRGSASDRFLGLRVRISSGAWKSVSCKCCVLSGRGLCDGPIACPEESYRLWCVIVCDLETSRIRQPWTALGCCAREKNLMCYIQGFCPSRCTQMDLHIRSVWQCDVLICPVRINNTFLVATVYSYSTFSREV
jgi:hypothetical protein